MHVIDSIDLNYKFFLNLYKIQITSTNTISKINYFNKLF